MRQLLRFPDVLESNTLTVVNVFSQSIVRKCFLQRIDPKFNPIIPIVEPDFGIEAFSSHWGAMFIRCEEYLLVDLSWKADEGYS